MKFKLVALDLDDTLLNSRMEISDENRRAVRWALDKGVDVVIATGRPYSSAAEYAARLGIKTPLITFNGALIRWPDDGEVVEELCIDLDPALEIARIGQDLGAHLNIFIENRLYAAERNEYSRMYYESTGVPTVAVGDTVAFLERTGKGPQKMLLIETDSRKMERLAAVYREGFGERLNITSSKSHYLEFMNRRASKGYALGLVAEHLGVKAEEVLAMGDGSNDLDMIRYAGCGVAMSDGASDLKAEADLIAPASDEDGVACILRDLLNEGRGDRISSA